MCASYNPPTENITSFNSSLFNQPEETLSQAEADQLYLSKKNNDVSTAPNTDFNGAVTIKGTQNFGVQGVAGGITNINRRLRIQDINAAGTGYGDMYYAGGSLDITSQSTNTALSTSFNFLTCPIGSTTGIQKLQITDTTTKILNTLEVGVSGSSSNAYFKNGIVMYDVNSPYTNYSSFSPQGFTQNYTMYAGTTTATRHIFYTYNNANTSSSTLAINNASVDVQPNLNLTNRLVYNASSYSFPLASQQTQGYYLKTTGTALATPTYVSNTYITCVTSPTVAIGVWRIDYSVTNTISGGGNITATDTLVSTTINNSTPVSFTGSQQITHTTENYSAGDKHIITGSFTYNQSTAGVLYLTINRVFASGSYSWVGELAITRIA